MNISLEPYARSARDKFKTTYDSLSQNEAKIRGKMNGKTTEGLAGSFIGSILWFIAFVVAAACSWSSVNPPLMLFAMTVVFALILFMMIDNRLDFSYAKNIVPYIDRILNLKKRVSEGKELMEQQKDSFMAAKETGWDFPLQVSESIPAEAFNILNSLNKIESLKKGSINTAKNTFFFTASVVVTLVGCIAQFSFGGDVITKIVGETFSSGLLLLFNCIALTLVLVGTVLLAKLAWSKTNCNVTNITLFATIVGPIVFIPLIAILTVLVLIIFALIQIVLIVAGIVLVLATTSVGGRRDND